MLTPGTFLILSILRINLQNSKQSFFKTTFRFFLTKISCFSYKLQSCKFLWNWFNFTSLHSTCNSVFYLSSNSEIQWNVKKFQMLHSPFWHTLYTQSHSSFIICESSSRVLGFTRVGDLATCHSFPLFTKSGDTHELLVFGIKMSIDENRQRTELCI